MRRASGNLYWSVANGLFDPALQSYGDSLVKMDPTTLAVLDTWTPTDQQTISNDDKGAPSPTMCQHPSLLGVRRPSPHML